LTADVPLVVTLQVELPAAGPFHFVRSFNAAEINFSSLRR
jgi:hypothetical protein